MTTTQTTPTGPSNDHPVLVVMTSGRTPDSAEQSQHLQTARRVLWSTWGVDLTKASVLEPEPADHRRVRHMCVVDLRPRVPVVLWRSRGLPAGPFNPGEPQSGNGLGTLVAEIAPSVLWAPRLSALGRDQRSLHAIVLACQQLADNSSHVVRLQIATDAPHVLWTADLRLPAWRE